MKDILEIEDKLRKHKEELRARYKVSELGIFGSLARGEGGEASDLDILVEFEEAPGLLEFLELEEYLSELTGMKVDLVRKKSVRAELRDSILKEAIML